METIVTLAASAMGRKSAEKRHARLLAEGVDISEHYRNLRAKGLKNGKNKRKKKA